MSAVYGVLFSHAPGNEVDGPFTSPEAAEALAHEVITAQPGIEHELMWRDGADRGWFSVDTGLPPATVARVRWGGGQ